MILNWLRLQNVNLIFRKKVKKNENKIIKFIFVKK